MTTITQIEKIEFDLVAALANLPAGARQMRAKVVDTLAKVRDRKRQLLARSPDVLRKAAGNRPTAEPHWFGLPAVAEEVAEIVTAARDRVAELERLAKRSNELGFHQLPRNPDAALAGEVMTTIKGALSRPMLGDRSLISFLNRHAKPA
jgi:hypothetical protein